MKPSILPENLYKYFWDVQPKNLDPDIKKTYIIERLLELGDQNALRFLKKTYSKDDLTTVIQRSRVLSRKTANFYTLYYNLDPQSVLCLQKDFQSKHRPIWRH